MNALDVKGIRRKLGFTQTQLAQRLGVHLRTVQIWESGGAIPETKCALLRILMDDNKTAPAEEEPQGKLVPLLPIAAYGGTLSDFSVAVREGDITDYIRSPFKGAQFAIPVRGDSMAPEIPAGAVAFIRRINEKAFLEWGKVYVLDTVNGVVIKKLFPADSPEKVKCVSNNTTYQPFEVDGQDIISVYQVIGYLVTY